MYRSSGATSQLLLHWLTWNDRTDRCTEPRRSAGSVSGDLQDRLVDTYRPNGDPGLELGTGGAALAHRWESPFRGVPRLRS